MHRYGRGREVDLRMALFALRDASGRPREVWISGKTTLRHLRHVTGNGEGATKGMEHRMKPKNTNGHPRE